METFKKKLNVSDIRLQSFKLSGFETIRCKNCNQIIDLGYYEYRKDLIEFHCIECNQIHVLPVKWDQIDLEIQFDPEELEVKNYD